MVVYPLSWFGSGFKDGNPLVDAVEPIEYPAENLIVLADRLLQALNALRASSRSLIGVFGTDSGNAL